ncbi:hypothetical protein LTR84_001083 [Exophiala bonariae]|uniref:Uncharacterized protein n=1 Tax=Exophiala bonariae TaxID=1690606 RepID=A0AAV9NSY9_9EURO|nr:hypothetical protein LTR84_001083 [Exophiala bonariae]
MLVSSSVLSALPLLALNLFVHFILSSAGVHGRQSCDQGHFICSPPGIFPHDGHFIETHLADLYMNLLTTVKPQDGTPPVLFDTAESRFPKSLQTLELPQTICCAETTDCLLLTTWKVPLCWDRFTTNYWLSDKSYGSMTTGVYHCASGGSANLFTGDFNLPNGQTGNLYAQNKTEQPNLSTLHLPTPYTSSGVGSAIPATAVGTDASYSTQSTTAIGYGQPQNITQAPTGAPTAGGGFPIVTNIINLTPTITPPIVSGLGAHVEDLSGQKILLVLAIVIGSVVVLL